MTFALRWVSELGGRSALIDGALDLVRLARRD